MASRFLEMTLGSIAAGDYRAAAVLNRFGLDFCCGGNRTLEDACRAKGCDADAVAAGLDDTFRSGDARLVSDTGWNPADLVDHIVATHHRYVRDAVPRIAGYLQKIVEVHGSRHPELVRIAEHFDELARELSAHMYKEEEILFPYVRQLAASMAGTAPPANVFGTVGNPIRVMETEH